MSDSSSPARCVECGDPASDEINGEPMCSACADEINAEVEAEALDRIAELLRDPDLWERDAGEGIRQIRDLVSGTGRNVDPEPRAPVSELLGSDPDWLGGQSVDDYIREIRRH